LREGSARQLSEAAPLGSKSEPPIRARRSWRRWAGLALIAYGVLGLLAMGAAALAVGPQIESLGSLGGTIETQRASLALTLRDTSTTLADAAGGFAGFEESLAQARASTDRAAALARDVSGTMADIGRAMRVTILGIQPLAELAPQFERAGEQLLLLGGDLDGIGAAMTRNVGDVQRARADLSRVQRQVEQLAIAAEMTRIPAGTGGDLAAIRFGAYALMAWLAGLALACLLIGEAIWRSASGTPARDIGRSAD
jgi:hypothetical protein